MGAIAGLGSLIAATPLLPDIREETFGTLFLCSLVLGGVAGHTVDSLLDKAEYSLREKAKALAEKREASEVKEEVSAKAPAEKAVEKASKPTASRPKADRVKETLIRNKQMVRC